MADAMSATDQSGPTDFRRNAALRLMLTTQISLTWVRLRSQFGVVPPQPMAFGGWQSGGCEGGLSAGCLDIQAVHLRPG
jgi:hypothetical protein